ncbi:hypothetical protein FJQ87_18525 (plasmid) [Shewanella sp. SNU WT4]|uniref:hypothetical protein n=1 Tax=Shewanella sp. SNU WT4 TaxID=2590015 RepID=UPI00112AD8F0|nr:hypothetical protein [Shewanella sp. SNU WT4]QDF68701.1 hypothetical protein FJQ87_18525 [Shewanella sp. SNU WT4]
MTDRNPNEHINNPDILTAEELMIMKLIDAETTPGFGASFTPEEAELAGAFFEDALTEQDLMDAIEEPGDDN